MIDISIPTEVLLSRAAGGDDDALNEIVTIYNDKVKKFIKLYINDLHSGEDILQDIWLKIFNYRHRLSEIENMDNWLFLVVRNKCFDFLNNRNGNYLFETNDEVIESLVSDDDLLERCIKRQDAETLREYIERLPDALKLPLIMYYFHGFSYNEIENVMKITNSTLKWRLHMGRQKLKKLIISERKILNYGL